MRVIKEGEYNSCIALIAVKKLMTISSYANDSGAIIKELTMFNEKRMRRTKCEKKRIGCLFI